MPSRDISTEENLREDFAGLVDESDIICYAILGDPGTLNPGREGAAARGEGHTEVLGVAFYGHFSTESRATEIGAMFAPVLQRTAASTEVLYLLLKHVLDKDSPILGESGIPYRRVAWKCNHLNPRSRNSALRVGFIFEGTNRQYAIVKGRTRDTDVFSLLDKEWPACKDAMERWFDGGNWCGEGRQRRKLQEIREEIGGVVCRLPVGEIHAHCAKIQCAVEKCVVGFKLWLRLFFATRTYAWSRLRVHCCIWLYNRNESRRTGL